MPEVKQVTANSVAETKAKVASLYYQCMLALQEYHLVKELYERRN